MITKFQNITLHTQRKNFDDVNNWLTLNGALTITIEDAGDEPIYEPEPDTMPLWSEIVISAIFPLDTNPEQLIAKLTYDYASDIISSYTSNIIEDSPQNYKYDFDPICFGSNFWIYPYEKHPVGAEKNRCYINLEPGLAFGSGEHPTTALCLEWLAKNLPAHEDPIVIDYGSGSGILSLAAVKLGAQRVLAVDNDPQAILATKDNATRNNISDQISAFLPEELPSIEADYLVANILANPLIKLAPTLIGHLKSGGQIVLSGILEEQTDFVVLAYMNHGITISDISKKGAWVRIVGQKQ